MQFMFVAPVLQFIFHHDVESNGTCSFSRLPRARPQSCAASAMSRSGEGEKIANYDNVRTRNNRRVRRVGVKFPARSLARTHARRDAVKRPPAVLEMRRSRRGPPLPTPPSFRICLYSHGNPLSRPDSSSIDADEHGTTTGGEIKYLWVPLCPSAAPHRTRSQVLMATDRVRQAGKYEPISKQIIQRWQKKHFFIQCSFVSITCSWSVRRPIRMHDKQRHFPTVQMPYEEGGREEGDSTRTS